MQNKKEMSIDELAIIINKSFDHVAKDMNSIAKDVSEIKRKVEKLKDGQIRLEQGQKEIKQDLTFTARKYELTGIETRVEKLEYKMAKMSK